MRQGDRVQHLEFGWVGTAAQKERGLRWVVWDYSTEHPRYGASGQPETDLKLIDRLPLQPRLEFV